MHYATQAMSDHKTGNFLYTISLSVCMCICMYPHTYTRTCEINNYYIYLFVDTACPLFTIQIVAY